MTLSLWGRPCMAIGGLPHLHVRNLWRGSRKSPLHNVRINVGKTQPPPYGDDTTVTAELEAPCNYDLETSCFC